MVLNNLPVAVLEVPSIPPTVITKIFNIPITNTMVSALVTSLVLIIFAVIVRVFFIPRWNKTFDKKSPFRLFLEAMVNMFDNTAVEQTGKISGFTGVFYFSMAAFICLGTLIEMTGLRPPTSDLNLTLAMGISSFILIGFFGFKEKKLGRFKRYINPLNIISDAIVPFSLALRLFGSVFSGFMIMHLIYSLPWFGLIGVPAVASVMFTIFHALIQSYIFMFLSMCFIGEAVD